MGDWGETLKGEVEETESSRGSGVNMSQSRRDGNYSALLWMPYLHVSHSFTLDYIISVSINCPVVIVVRHCRLVRSVVCRWQTGRVDSDGAKLQDPERGICIQPVREQCLRGQLRDSCSSSECQLLWSYSSRLNFWFSDCVFAMVSSPVAAQFLRQIWSRSVSHGFLTQRGGIPICDYAIFIKPSTTQYSTYLTSNRPLYPPFSSSGPQESREATSYQCLQEGCRRRREIGAITNSTIHHRV